MVQRYSITDTANDLLEVENEPMVLLKDYQFLQAALREALDGWGSWADTMKGASSEEKRIAELRKQYLDT